MPLPSDAKTFFLGGIFVLSMLTAAYVASEIVLPMILWLRSRSSVIAFVRSRPLAKFSRVEAASATASQDAIGDNFAQPDARSANRASTGSDFDPVLFIIEARWFSTVRWLMPRSAAMFLLGWPASTLSITSRCRVVRPAR